MDNFEKIYFDIILEAAGKNFLKKEINGDVSCKILTKNTEIEKILKNLQI